MLKRFIFILILSVALLAALKVSSVQAQWTSLAPNLIGTGPYDNAGAMAYADGVAWACLYDLYKSTDQGTTWQVVTTPNQSGSIFHGVTFYDKNNGAVCTDQGLFVTTNQGQSWQSYFTSEPFFEATYSGSPNAIAAGSTFAHFTSDGGKSWNTTQLGRVTKDVHSVGPGQVLAFVETNANSIVEYTSDYGATWTERAGTMDADSHSFGVLDCDANTIYGINEEGGNYSVDNSQAEIFLSKDGGATFTSIEQYGLAVLSGCVAITPGAIYVPSRTSGILQSTDGGSTWTLLPGPNCPIDSRDIIAINDTILLAADVDGTIWRNMHGVPAPSGSTGSSKALQVTEQYSSDTLAPCSMANASVYFSYFSCSHGSATLDSASLTGSPNFSVIGAAKLPRTLGTLDSLQIGYSSTSSTLDTAYLHLTYTSDGGNHDTTLLIASEKFSVYTANSYGDGTLKPQPNTLQNIVVSEKLPAALHASGLTVTSIIYTLSYNNAVIDIIGSVIAGHIVPPSGWTVSNATAQSGVLTVTLTNTSNASIQDSLYLGTVGFTALSPGGKTSLVLMTAIRLETISGAIAFCLATEGDYVANVVVQTAGVEPESATHDLQLSVYPNPIKKGSELHLEGSVAHSVDAQMQLLDILGAPVVNHEFTKGLAGTYHFTIPSQLASGTYYLRLETTEQVKTRKISVVE